MMGHFLSFISNSHIRRIALPACIVSGALGAAIACGADEQPVNTGVLAPRTKPATQTVTVTVTFPDGVKDTTNSLHVWFLEGDDAGANCADLVGGATDPNAGPLGHLGDVVEKGGSDTITAKGVSVGSPTLVYVEAVDDNGQVEWAGCVEAVKGKATVALDKARVYKCDAEGVKNGAPCDDGDPCTVGESCKDTECKSGKPRDCTALDTDCSVGTCEPDLGCIPKAYNDGATCDDGLNCTTDDTCASGDCVGTPKNCDTNSGGCRIGSVCSETSFGNCTAGTVQDYGTPCNDAKFCTTGDQCDFSGNCVGTPMDCSTSGGGCLTCSETTHSCTEPKPVGTSCSAASSSCVVGGTCNASGACVGQPRDCSYINSGNGCTVGVCDAVLGCTSVYVPTGTACDDGYDCTVGDYCSGGSCLNTGYAPNGTICGSPCQVGGSCTGSSSYCSFSTYAPSGTSCDDRNPCTVTDTCSSGTCYAGSYATTGTPCTMNGCPNGAQCTSSGRCACK